MIHYSIGHRLDSMSHRSGSKCDLFSRAFSQVSCRSLSIIKGLSLQRRQPWPLLIHPRSLNSSQEGCLLARSLFLKRQACWSPGPSFAFSSCPLDWKPEKLSPWLDFLFMTRIRLARVTSDTIGLVCHSRPLSRSEAGNVLYESTIFKELKLFCRFCCRIFLAARSWLFSLLLLA